MSDDSKYRLSQDDVLARGPALLDYLASPATAPFFWKKAWEFLFELQIDLETAMRENDINREKLYVGGIRATGNMVKGVLDTYKLYGILNEENDESS
jgi:hypothetical protein